ncbi:MAG: sigma-70 family RNA polymerase sigma factor [Bacteroidota bacterium]
MARNERDQIFELEMIVHYKSVYNFLFRLTGNETEASDLVQDTFARAYQKLDLYHQGTNARAWLFSIAHNLFINEWRKKGRRNETELDERVAYNLVDESNSMASFDDLRKEGALAQDFSDQVVKALSTLNPEQRAIIIMADLYDFSEKEIAKAMDQNLNTIKSRTHRARLKLIKQLSTYAEGAYGLTNTRNLG